MTLVGLALRNAFVRNKARSVLTMLGTVVATLAFVFLRTALAAWHADTEASASDRVVVRNAISVTQTLPLSYLERIEQIPGVKRVTFSNWFGGIYKHPKNFFPQFAVDPKSALEVLDVRFLAGAKDGFLSNRESCVVGTKVARRHGFAVGDKLPLRGDVYPGDWRFTVAGIVDSPSDSSIAGVMLLHWPRVNETLPGDRRDHVGVYSVLLASAADSSRVIHDIDALFANSDNETRTETEKAFRLQSLTGAAAILGALETVSGVILAIMALVLGNTIAMALRERTPEFGAMRAIGFLPSHVLLLAFCEGVALALCGGLLGILLARPFLTAFGKAVSSMGFLTEVALDLGTAAATLAATVAVGALASAWPALQASKLDVVTALRRQE